MYFTTRTENEKIPSRLKIYRFENFLHDPYMHEYSIFQSVYDDEYMEEAGGERKGTI